MSARPKGSKWRHGSYTTLLFYFEYLVYKIILKDVPKVRNFFFALNGLVRSLSYFRFKYDMDEGKPAVYSIGNKANDAERGLYWTAYTSRNSTKGLVPFEGGKLVF